MTTEQISTEEYINENRNGQNVRIKEYINRKEGVYKRTELN